MFSFTHMKLINKITFRKIKINDTSNTISIHTSTCSKERISDTRLIMLKNKKCGKEKLILVTINYVHYII